VTNNTSSFPEYSTNQSKEGDLSPTTANYYAGLNLDVSYDSQKANALLRKAGITIVDCN